MNQNQKKYAMNRIEVLASIKIREAESRFTSKKVEITNEEKYRLIASGKVKIFSYEKVSRNHYSSPDLYPSFDFSAYEKPAKLDESKFNPIKEKVSKLATEAKDQIMLGDCEEALKLIKQLEDIKV